ncbi:MAG: RnfABCDGE type electron transport complex subunit D, partial [Planctomycetota bacterium]
MEFRQKSKKLFLKQFIMRKVLLALLPCAVGSIYFFGWRSLFVILWSALVGFFVEYLFTRKRGEPVTESIFVTTTIYALIMPPTIPVHVLTIGVVFAVMFTKEIFGGFGRNIFNPAMAGRCFVYVCFPVALTASWAPSSQGFHGAFDRWSTVSEVDTVTSATPMAYLKAGRLVLDPSESASSRIPFDIPEGQSMSLKRSALLIGLLFGRISGTMGVTSALLIIIGGAYLFITKTASREIILSLIITYGILNQVLFWFGVEPVPGAWPAVLGGGFLFGAFFMATDPVSAPKTKEAKILYGILIGTCTLVIRNFSIFNGGLMFSILIGNMFAPIMDYGIRSL